MKRRLAMLLSAVAVAVSVAAFSPTSPASADLDVCAGLGTATTAVPLTYPGLGPHREGGFAFNLNTGACLTLPEGLQATGTVTGWCGLSWGTGTTHNGHPFAWVGVGGTLILTGLLLGVVNAVPDLPNQESCVTGADRFLVNGAVVLIHCNPLVPVTVPTPFTNPNPLNGITVLGCVPAAGK